MEVMEKMNADEMKTNAIEKFINIQRIKKYGQEEIDYQERVAKAEMNVLGIPTEELEITK